MFKYYLKLPGNPLSISYMGYGLYTTINHVNSEYYSVAQCKLVSTCLCMMYRFLTPYIRRLDSVPGPLGRFDRDTRVQSNRLRLITHVFPNYLAHNSPKFFR